MADSQGVPFTIRVIEGDLSVAILQDGQAPGVLQLLGRAMPYRSLITGTVQRMKTRWYPGNPEATQQVIGPTLKPLSVNGKFEDRYLGDGQAAALRDMLDDICARGLSVEVTGLEALTANSASPIAGEPFRRVGLIKETEFNHLSGVDILWKLDFEWRSKGQTTASPIAASSRISPREGFTASLGDLDLAVASWEAFRDGPVVAAFGLPQTILVAAADALERIDVARDGISRAAGAIAAVSSIPLQEARSVISACSGAISSLGQLTAQLLALPALALEVRDDALDLLSLRVGILENLQQLFSSSATCADARDGVAEIAIPDVIAEVTAPAGTDLRDVAFKMYGDPDLWWEIAQANGISGSAVPSPPAGPSDFLGATLKIPRIQGGSSLSTVC